MARLSTRTLLSTLLGASIVCPAAIARADVVLEPNTIQGKARFSNTDPTVVALLQQLGMSSTKVTATSTSPAGYQSNTTTFLGTPVSRDYELSAESGAGGPSGVTYSLGATGFLYASSWYTASGQYWFQPVGGVVLEPVAQQPGGVTADLADCIGLVRVRWGLDPQCDTPYVIGSGSIKTSYGQSNFQNTSEHYIFQLGGTSEVKDLFVTTGNDPTQNTLTFTFPLTLNPTCDAVQDICIDMSQYLDGAGALGWLTGPFDVLGEVEQGDTYIRAYEGPANNERYGYFTPPEMPIASPATWWTLPNMMPGDYKGYATGLVRTGRQATSLTTPRMGPTYPAGPMTVVSGAGSDLQKVIGGQSRYPFVMKPARFEGEILLVDPYVTANPGAYSSLSALRFSADPPWSSASPWGTTVRAQDVDTYGGRSTTAFDGSFDQSTGQLASAYDLLVVDTYDIPTQWVHSGLTLDFYDLAAEREGFLILNPDSNFHLMAPGDVVPVDHAYCFNEVDLPYSIASGLLFDPYAVVNGSFNGTDWRGVVTSYTANGTALGYPKTNANAATNGIVHLALPQGTFTIQPGASVQAPSGALSTATFAKTTLDLGCGQRLTVSPGLSVSAMLPLCAESASPDIVGSVQSSGANVDRIWYTLNGGPDIDICSSNCGADPQFSVPVSLVACGNTIQVFATSGGQTASVTTQTTWEDPSDGIDCEGSCEPPPQPADECAVVTAVPLVCSGDAGGYALEFKVTNQTTSPIAHVLLPDPRVSPSVVTLPSPLQPGDSTVVQAWVSGVNPGSSLCFDVGMTDPDHEACCSQEVCVDVPACCFSIESESAACIPGAAGGEFTYSFDFQNRTLDTIEHVFVFPPDGVTVSPQYVDVPTTPPGGVANVGPLTFSGANPGESLCVTIGIHDEEMNQCCADEVCFDVPEPCEEDLPPVKFAPEDGARAASAESCSVGKAGGSSRGVGPIALGIAALLAFARRRRG